MVNAEVAAFKETLTPCPPPCPPPAPPCAAAEVMEVNAALGHLSRPRNPCLPPRFLAPPCAAAEVMEVNAAVAALKETLSSLQANADGSRSAMLKLNLREAQETLSRWVL